jgi:hypothetical protein
VNDAPSALASAVSGLNSAPIPIVLTGSDPEGSALTFNVVANPTSGTLSGTRPNLSYLPNPGFIGSDSLSFTTSDGQLTSAPALVSITVLSGNRAPTASPASLSTAEDTALPVTLAGTDPDGNTLSFSVTTPPVFGTLSGTAPNLVYTPGSHYSGPDSFSFTVSDGSLTSAPASVTLTVTPVNDAPTASPASLTTAEDTALPVTLAGTDPDGNTLSFTITTPPVFGTLSGNAPNLVYTPGTNYSGPDSFAFTVSDGSLTSAPASVTLTVTPVNDAPVPSSFSRSVIEDATLLTTLTATDVDSSSLTFAVVRSPASGTLSGPFPNLVYRPNTNFFGSDSFTYTVSDGTTVSTQATVSITVVPVNDAPSAFASAVSGLNTAPIPIVLTGSDPEGSALTFNVVANPTSGTLSGTRPNLSYLPNPGFTGSDSLSFTTSDGQLTSAPALVSITVLSGNRAPTASPASLTTAEDTALPVTLAGTDPDGNTLSFSVTTPPVFGTLSGTAPNLVYTPGTHYSGPDSFSFTVSDGSLTSAPSSVTLTVTPVNDAPTALASAVSGINSGPILIALTGSDPEGSTLSFNVVANPTSGTLSGTAPNLSYLPNPGFSGSDSLSFTTSDGQLTSAPALVSITVLPGNRAPTASPASLSTPEDTTLSITLAGTDPDGNTLSFSITTPPAFGTLSGTAPNLIYRPNTNYNGADSIRFTVSDGSLVSAPATVSITVTPVIDPVTTTSDFLMVLRAGTGTTLHSGGTSVMANDSLGDAVNPVVSLRSAPAHGSLTLAANGTFTYRHHGGTAPEDSFRYAITSSLGVSAETTVRIGILDIQNISRTGNDVSVHFPVVSGVFYSVESSTQSPGSNGDWQSFANFTASSDGDAALVVYGAATLQRYYRVICPTGSGALVTGPWGHWSPEASARLDFANPFHGRPVRNGVAANVGASTLQIQGAQWSPGQLAMRDGLPSHIVAVNATGTGTGVGEWWPIVDHTASTLTLGTGNRPLTTALSTGTPLEVVALPTVTEIFGLPNSPDCRLAIGDSVSFRGDGRTTAWQLTCSTNALGEPAYFATRGTIRSGPLDGSTLTILPSQACTYQRGSGTPQRLFLEGRVRFQPFVHYLFTGVSFIASAFPTPITLNNSGLALNGWVRDTDFTLLPVMDDYLLLTDDAAAAQSGAPSSLAFYHNGNLQPEGWYTAAGSPAGQRQLLMGLPARISLILRIEPFLWTEPSPWP